MKIILVAESSDDWLGQFEGVETIDPRDYLASSPTKARGRARVYNLCRSYAYQTAGYYVSLLAEARGERPMPDVTTIQDLTGAAAVRLIPQSLEELIEKSFKGLGSDEFVLSVYFGQNLAKRYERLAKELYNLFQAPLLQFKFSRRSKWRLRRAAAISLGDVPESHREFVAAAASEHFTRGSFNRPKRKSMRYDMAVLHQPDEGELAPSDEAALKKFVKAGAAQGINVELITRTDSGRLLEFDALFIRETTAVNHHTYRLARRAEASGDGGHRRSRFDPAVHQQSLLGRDFKSREYSRTTDHHRAPAQRRRTGRNAFVSVCSQTPGQRLFARRRQGE